jgi:hypothetical protein
MFQVLFPEDVPLKKTIQLEKEKKNLKILTSKDFNVESLVRQSTSFSFFVSLISRSFLRSKFSKVFFQAFHLNIGSDV